MAGNLISIEEIATDCRSALKALDKKELVVLFLFDLREDLIMSFFIVF